MKKIFLLTALAVLLGVATATAQQISVVTESGETTIYQTFQAAIEGASDGSVIYLPGGGFTISDDVKITKRLTIIGIGHRSDNDNVDGTTTITGNLWFNQGSSGSGVLGCYITGNVNIGEGDASVNNVLVKYCNLNSVQVLNNTCMSTYINQNYIRNTCILNGASGIITNNVMHSIRNVNGGQIVNNQLQGEFFHHSESIGPWYASHVASYYYCIEAYNTTIFNNVITMRPRSGNNYDYHSILYGNDNQVNANMALGDFGDNPINIGSTDWNDVFKNWNGGAINPMSDFHFKDEYQQYSDVGIYGGTGFNDKQMAPIPFIVAKSIGEQTDAAGKLRIRVKVKAGE